MEIEEPTEWSAGRSPQGMSESACVNPTKLNESQERHLLPTVDETLAQLAGEKVHVLKIGCQFRVLKIPLASEFTLLTTFITPLGRYCFNWLPFGITSVFPMPMLRSMFNR